jgi:hypothetical protein
LISCTHSPPIGGRSVGEGRAGGMKMNEGRNSMGGRGHIASRRRGVESRRTSALGQPESAGGCDGHHEVSDLVAAGEPAHRIDDSVAPVWPHQRRMVRAGLMEKIMSKSNDSSKLVRTTPIPDLGGAATFTVRECETTSYRK